MRYAILADSYGAGTRSSPVMPVTPISLGHGALEQADVSRSWYFESLAPARWWQQDAPLPRPVQRLSGDCYKVPVDSLAADVTPMLTPCWRDGIVFEYTPQHRIRFARISMRITFG
jgi:hypothetical protein